MHFKAVLLMVSVGVVLNAASGLVSVSLSASHRMLKMPSLESRLCAARCLNLELGRELMEWLCALPMPPLVLF